MGDPGVGGRGGGGVGLRVDMPRKKFGEDKTGRTRSCLVGMGLWEQA